MGTIEGMFFVRNEPKWMGLIALVMVALTGCAPPPPAAQDYGHQIVPVKQTPAPPFETRTVDGVDYKISRSPVGRFGGVFYDAEIGSGPKTFNPLASMDATSSRLGGLLFSGLTDMDAHSGETVPHLAQSVQILPDQKTYVVKLRRGLVWSDGHPLTADDVVFTWREIILKGLGNPSTRDVLMVNGQLPSVKKVDALTVQFYTPVPFAPFLANLGNPILPKHVVAPVIKNNPKAFDTLYGVTTPPKDFVVSGPFVLEEYMSGQRAVFKRNPRYFMLDKAGHKLPYLDRYVVTFVQDQNAELLQFEQGHIDQIGVPGAKVFYVKHLTQPDFDMVDLGPATGTTFVTFNLNNRRQKEGRKPYVNPVRSRWFRDVRFRQAVDYALHRKRLVDNVLMGVGAPLFTAESLSSIFLNPKLAHGHPTDLDHARALLKQAGFHWTAAGRLQDAQNHPVEFELLTNTGNLEREAVGVSVKNDLEALGMKVNFRPIDFNVLVGRVQSSEWEAIILGLTGSPTEPNGGKNVWHSTGALHLFNQRDPARDLPEGSALEPWEAELDRLFDQGATTLDKAKRKAIYHQYQQVVYDQLPVIYLYSPKSIIAVNRRIQNRDFTPLGTFHNLESIWVLDAKKAP